MSADKPRVIAVVDAGFVREASARKMGMRPHLVDIDPVSLKAWCSVAAGRLGGSLERIYWYEAQWPVEKPQYAEQRRSFDRIEEVPGIRLRLGHLDSRQFPWMGPILRAVRDSGGDVDLFKQNFEEREERHQKGVDTLMVLDITRLATNDVYDWMILFAGDRDLAEAVRNVQDQGKNVLVAYPDGAGVAKELRYLADLSVGLDETYTRQLVSGWRDADRLDTDAETGL